MERMADILRRTELQELGRYLLGEDPDRGDITCDRADLILDALEDDLYLSIRRCGGKPGAEAEQSVRTMEDTAIRLGFLAGLRAGARLTMALTADGELYL